MTVGKLEVGVPDPAEVAVQAAASAASLRRREEHVAEWSAALLGVLQGTPPSPRGGGPREDESAGWRSNVGGLTPEFSRTNSGRRTVGNEAIDEDEAPEGEPNSVRVEVSVGKLGTIALAVERGSSGLRLVLSAAHQSTTQLLESECRALEQSLAEGGLLVESIRFVTMTNAGPDVASGRVVASKRFAKAAEQRAEPGSAMNSKARRLNAVG